MTDSNEPKRPHNTPLAGGDPRPLTAIRRLKLRLRDTVGVDEAAGANDGYLLGVLKEFGKKARVRFYGERPTENADRMEIGAATFSDPEVRITTGATLIRRGQVLWDELSLNEEDFASALLIFPGADTDPPRKPQRAKPGPKGDGKIKMVEAFRQLKAEGHSYPNKKAAHKAVIDHLGFKVAPNGYSYQTFTTIKDPDLVGLPPGDDDT